MSYFSDDENSNFSIFKQNFTSNRINYLKKIDRLSKKITVKSLK